MLISEQNIRSIASYVTHDTHPGRNPNPDDRLQQVESLHLRGWTQRRIAVQLGISPRTVHRDLQRIEQRRLAQLTRSVASRRVRSIAVYLQVQTVLWKVIDTLMETEDPKYAPPIIAAGRVIGDMEKKATGAYESLAADAQTGEISVRDLMAQLTQQQIDSVTPEQIRAWDEQSEREALERETSEHEASEREASEHEAQERNDA